MACLPPRWKATHPGSGCRSGTNSNTCDPAKIPAQSTTPYQRALDYLAKGLPVSKHWLLWRAKIFDQAALAETGKRLQDEGGLGQEKKDHDYPVLSRGGAEEAAKAPKKKTGPAQLPAAAAKAQAGEYQDVEIETSPLKHGAVPVLKLVTRRDPDTDQWGYTGMLMTSHGGGTVGGQTTTHYATRAEAKTAAIAEVRKQLDGLAQRNSVQALQDLANKLRSWLTSIEPVAEPLPKPGAKESGA